MATHSSSLAWRIQSHGQRGLAVHSITKSLTRLRRLSMHAKITNINSQLNYTCINRAYHNQDKYREVSPILNAENNGLFSYQVEH